MQLKFKHTYILAMLLLVSISCRQTKYVPDGRYLLDKNKIVQDKTSPFEKEDLEEIIRQKPNKKSLFIKWKLAAYNSIDTAKVAAKRDRKNLKLREKNQKRRNKAAAVNERRIERAREKNAELYTKKIPKLKDTINPNLFFREWLMRKMGQPPVIFDSILFDKSLEQLQAFMRTKGYYNANVSGAVRYKKNRKAIVTYAVQPGEAFVIDSFFIKSASPRMLTEYKNYLKKNDINFVEEVFDAEMLDDHRSAVSLYMRNKSYYGFSPSHIRFEADTVRPSELKVSIGIIIQDRLVHHPHVADSMIVKPHTPTKIRNVYFHISDSLEYSGIYRQLLDSAQLTMDGLQFLPSLDTLVYKGMARGGNEFDPLREAVFYYNGRPFVKPELLE